MAEPFIGQIQTFAFPFAPSYWAFCNGATIPINQATTLYALIGNLFGGSGTSFALPNLIGTQVCGTGQGPGLSNRALGQVFGTSTVTLDQTTMPSHLHTANAVAYTRGSVGRTSVPTATSGLTTAVSGTPYTDGPADTAMSAGSIGPAGGGGPHNNLQPFVALNYGIALLGSYPEFE